MSNEEARTLITVKRVSKSFKLPHEQIRSVKGLFVNMFRRRKFEKQEVLREIDINVVEGEFLGIIGRNGSGKSTLLKLLAGIYVPDEGEINIKGKLTPFIELGVGFNPDLTGRENIFLNGALLGFSRREMGKMYKDIVSFAELEGFMDQKLKNYSSGMQVRLAFSIAIKARTEILLIDEVLAVGDANFQKKCLDIFETFKEEGRTIIFVSHSMSTVKKFCDRAILINEGKIIAQGEPDIVATEYDLLNKEEKEPSLKERLSIQTRREARIVDSVMDIFDGDSEHLIEYGAAEGRHVNLINSIGISTIGIDSIQPNTKNKVYKSIDSVKQKRDFTGILLLDNRKSVNIKDFENLIKRLSDQKEPPQKIYIHIPLYEYQEYLIRNKDRRLSEDLSKPIRDTQLANLLAKHGYVAITSRAYGTDREYQYLEAIYERFDKERQEEEWG